MKINQVKTNQFKYSNTNKRYYTWDFYLKNTYGTKVAKIPIECGFTCPNRDGKISYGGCSFCSSLGSGEFNPHFNLPTDIQYQQGKEKLKSKWNITYTIPYLQSYSNTYCTVEQLQEKINPLLTKYSNEIVAIAIATRADCLPDDMLAYLQQLNTIKPLWIELGLQTSNDKTSLLLNRGHDYNCFKQAILKLKQLNIKTVVHIINGLPNETKDNMIQTIKDINILHPDAIKIHMLHILKDSLLGQQYLHQPWSLLTKQEYIDIVVNQLGYLSEDIIIQRLTGDGIINQLIAPLWTIKKTIVLNDIDKKMVQDNRYQGDYLNHFTN